MSWRNPMSRVFGTVTSNGGVTGVALLFTFAFPCYPAMAGKLRAPRRTPQAQTELDEPDSDEDTGIDFVAPTFLASDEEAMLDEECVGDECSDFVNDDLGGELDDQSLANTADGRVDLDAEPEDGADTDELIDPDSETNTADKAGARLAKISSTKCNPGASPAYNNSQVCCPNGYPYYYNGYCNKNASNGGGGNGNGSGSGRCGPGSSPAFNNSQTCCPNGYPFYYNGRCNKNTSNGGGGSGNGSGRCGYGSSPAFNNSQVCCRNGYPYYYNGVCNSNASNSSSGNGTVRCGAGSSRAFNNSQVCCPFGYPFYYNGSCHTRL